MIWSKIQSLKEKKTQSEEEAFWYFILMADFLLDYQATQGSQGKVTMNISWLLMVLKSFRTATAHVQTLITWYTENLMADLSSLKPSKSTTVKTAQVVFLNI